MTDNLPAPEPTGEVILYQSEDGSARIEAVYGPSPPQAVLAPCFSTGGGKASASFRCYEEQGD